MLEHELGDRGSEVHREWGGDVGTGRGGTFEFERWTKPQHELSAVNGAELIAS